MNPKILAPIVLLAVGLFAGKTFFAGAPEAPPPEPKVHGQVYVVPKDFLVNLADGRFAKLNVGLVLKHHYLDEAIAEASGGGHGAPKPPEGYGTLPQEALVRDIVTDELTGASAGDLITKSKREHLKEDLVKKIKKQTDVKVEEVILTDISVQ